MELQDHRPRVAAERRERMRLRLLGSAIQLGAANGPAAISIDGVVAAAEVSRGTFYKYFGSPDELIRELAMQVANELIRMAEPVVLRHEDPAERVACGIRVVSRTALDQPVVASFLVRLGWPDVRGPDMLLDFLRRDLNAGIEQGRFRRMPDTLALNIVVGAVLGAAHCMLDPGCEPDFAELSAAAALRGLGMDARTAERIARRPLPPIEPPASGLFAETLVHPQPNPTSSASAAAPAARARRSMRSKA